MSRISVFQRPFDLFMVLCLFTFVFISAFVEAPYCLGEDVRKDSKYVFLRMSYDWCSKADRLFIEKPLWVKYPLS